MKLVSGKVRSIVYTYLSTSTQYYRNLQMALNQICEKSGIDFKRAQIDAIASIAKLKSTQVSDMIDLSDPLNTGMCRVGDSQLYDFVNQAEDGTYLLRSVCPADNAKKELYGHSTVLVKEGPIYIYYDPNYGATLLSSDTDKRNAELYKKVKKPFYQFGVSQLRIYRMDRIG